MKTPTIKLEDPETGKRQRIAYADFDARRDDFAGHRILDAPAGTPEAAALAEGEKVGTHPVDANSQPANGNATAPNDNQESGQPDPADTNPPQQGQDPAKVDDDGEGKKPEGAGGADEAEKSPASGSAAGTDQTSTPARTGRTGRR